MSEAVTGLMLDVQRRLESLYALEPSAPVSDFLIGEADGSGYPGGGSRTLFSQKGDAVELGVILDAGTSHSLACSDPRQRLHSDNLGAFCTMAEEVSHFVYLLFCANAARHVTELELELQGEVDKYLSAVFLLSLQNEGAVSARLRELLFRNYRLKDGLSKERASRYLTASRLADRYCGHLEATFLRGARVAELVRESRRFYRLGQAEKLEKIAQLH